MIKTKFAKLSSLAIAVAMGVNLTAGCFASSLPFKDVPQSEWYYKEVAEAYDKGLIAGTASDEFSPNVALNRAMFATILYRMDGAKVEFSQKFSDVPAGTWYSEAVTWASNAGVTSGTSATTFSPNTPITREQICAMLYRYAGYKRYNTASTTDLAAKFKDAGKVSSYAKSAVAWCSAKSILSGSDGCILPQNNTKRCEAAAIINRFDNKYKNAVPGETPEEEAEREYNEKADEIVESVCDPNKPSDLQDIVDFNRAEEEKKADYSGAVAQFEGLYCINDRSLSFEVNLGHFDEYKWRDLNTIAFRVLKNGETLNDGIASSDLVTFETSDPSVMRVEFVSKNQQGFPMPEHAIFTPIGYGTTTITAIPKDGSTPATITVTILPHTCRFPTVQEVIDNYKSIPDSELDNYWIGCKGSNGGCNIRMKVKDFIAQGGYHPE